MIGRSPDKAASRAELEPRGSRQSWQRWLRGFIRRRPEWRFALKVVGCGRADLEHFGAASSNLEHFGAISSVGACFVAFRAFSSMLHRKQALRATFRCRIGHQRSEATKQAPMLDIAQDCSTMLQRAEIAAKCPRLLEIAPMCSRFGPVRSWRTFEQIARQSDGLVGQVAVHSRRRAVARSRVESGIALSSGASGAMISLTKLAGGRLTWS